MRWQIRPGFKLFATVHESMDYWAGNKSVKPLAEEGKPFQLTGDRLRDIWARGELGALIPLDDEAKKYFGDTKPRIAKAVSEDCRPAHVTQPSSPEAA
jgi:hypothetical protein